MRRTIATYLVLTLLSTLLLLWAAAAAVACDHAASWLS
jgi:hypothetical protein